ncbi:DUF2007 domain-containing protein [Rhodanobacter sp. MP7CTX1]|jgi:hypothetical protein|uniref:DUF2007 domain-containing protein n=1 Tax=Rhodanobacter sp. MP7CTX1 TaxID=2723084 RepID=UPI00161933D6|nr:DUF2007 domain-containing protein [Rhodanobacter sp. MP7CTX1]MBB6187598.1 hypothetical protein [Rhodanobacter sp. MP7CTX1]
MKTIKTYTTQLKAELAKLSLEHAGIPSMIVGIDVGVEGGASGVQLLVPGDCAKAAQKLLDSA